MVSMTAKEKENIIDEITELRKKFEDKWGESVFNLPSPCSISVKISLIQLRDILLHIIETGESIKDGYEKYIIKRKLTINDLTSPNRKSNKHRKNR